MKRLRLMLIIVPFSIWAQTNAPPVPPATTNRPSLHREEVKRHYLNPRLQQEQWAKTNALAAPRLLFSTTGAPPIVPGTTNRLSLDREDVKRHYLNPRIQQEQRAKTNAPWLPRRQ